MMAGPTAYRYYYSHRDPPADSAGRQRLSDADFHASAASFEDQVRHAGVTVPTWAQDFLRIAKAVHLADRQSKRGVAPDKWTRHIDVAIQVEDHTTWQGQVIDDLHRLLRILTADVWHVTLWPNAGFQGPEQALFTGPPVHKIALFSGGLDSTSYAAEALQDDSPISFVTYAVPKMRQAQAQVFSRLPHQTRHHPQPQPISQLVKGTDLSNRSRGLLFITTAVYAAAPYRAPEVVIPENGQLAINPPLTIARPAACSTRSVHPYSLMLINRIITAVGGNTTVHNPYLLLTKGEVCGRALQAGMTAEDLSLTVSCSHPPVILGNGTDNHCGRCFPCLVRRSALLASAGVDHSDYTAHFWETASDRTTADDAYALRQWLGRPFTTHDLLADLPLPPNTDRAAIMAMLHRGRNELSTMIDALVPDNHPFRLGKAVHKAS